MWWWWWWWWHRICTEHSLLTECAFFFSSGFHHDAKKLVKGKQIFLNSVVESMGVDRNIGQLPKCGSGNCKDSRPGTKNSPLLIAVTVNFRSGWLAGWLPCLLGPSLFSIL
jgi:hypothetical protein